MSATKFNKAVKFLKRFRSLENDTSIPEQVREDLLEDGWEEAEAATCVVLGHKPNTLSEATEIIAVVSLNTSHNGAEPALRRVRKFLLAMARSHVVTTMEPEKLRVAS